MYNNPYYGQQNQYSGLQNGQQPQMQYFQPQTYIPQQINKPIGIQGKVVDSIDVVRATDVPLDYSTSFFPLSDSSAIITKRIKQDGTTEILTYKPILEDTKEVKQPNYIEKDDFKRFLEDFREDLSKSINKYISQEIESLKNELLYDKVKEKK